MRDVSDKFCKGNKKDTLKFGDLFPKIMSFMRGCGEILYSRTHHRCQYDMAHAQCMIDT